MAGRSPVAGSELVRFAWLTLWAFLRISMNPHVFERPLTIPEAEAAVASWLSQPCAGILEPGEHHWDILQGLMRRGQTVGPLIMDAVLAAIALEHGAILHTTDQDFSRFPGLKWMNPLIPH
jgi:toxin-antitoxin system PIN domain toxin